MTIDESIQRFLGRAYEIINIPSKPTPKGFKIWVLANSGYIVDWLWHGKGSIADDGPYKLPAHWMKKEGFSKTQVVVLELLHRQEMPRNRHICWMDNLFTSQPLLTHIRVIEGIGGAGTVRTTKTPSARSRKSAMGPRLRRRK